MCKKDWQRASTHHRAVTIDLKAFGMNMENNLKFVGKRFNILEKITLKFAPYCTWLRGFYVHGTTLKEFFEKRATVYALLQLSLMIEQKKISWKNVNG